MAPALGKAEPLAARRLGAAALKVVAGDETGERDTATTLRQRGTVEAASAERGSALVDDADRGPGRGMEFSIAVAG